MNILFVSCTYPCPNAPQRGVFNQSLVEQVSMLHDVKVIAPVPWTTSLMDKLRRTHTEHISQRDGSPKLTSKVAFPTYYYPPKTLRSQYDRFFWRSIKSSYRELTRNWNPDLVIGYWTHPDGCAVVRIAEQHGIPSAIIVGGTDIRVRSRDRTRRRKILSVLDRCSQVIAVSNELRTQLLNLGVPRDKVQVIYRGTDSSIFSPGSKLEARNQLGIHQSEKLVLWVGRMVDIKRPSLAIDSYARLAHANNRPSRLVMIGNGNLRNALIKRAKRLGVEKQVQLVPSRSQVELAEWYRASDIVLLTSRSEGVPNVLVEAAACGTPFVATNVGGVSEVSRPGIDQLVENATPDSIAAALERAIFDNDSRLPFEFHDTIRVCEPPLSMGDKILRLFEQRNERPTPNRVKRLDESRGRRLSGCR